MYPSIDVLNYLKQFKLRAKKLCYVIQNEYETEKNIYKLMKGEPVQIGLNSSDHDLEISYKFKTKEIKGDDIIGFTFGGFSTRFWMLKNAINLLCPEQVTAEMLCWNMITIEIKGVKSLNLIIVNQVDMDILIKFLIIQMKVNNKSESEKLKKQILF